MAFATSETAVTREVNNLLLTMNREAGPLLGMLDLSAEFDTIDHIILLHLVSNTTMALKALLWCFTVLNTFNRLK